MNINALLKPKPTPYFDLIAEATGARLMGLPILERIMREDVFHSTLDWQTRDKFMAGAREAHQQYLSAKEFYDSENKVIVMGFHLSKTEEKLAQAVKKLERATACGIPERIDKCRAEVEKLTKSRENLETLTNTWRKITNHWLDFHFGPPAAANPPS